MANRGRYSSNHGLSDNDQDITDSQSRRTTRVRKQPKKFGDFMQITPTKRNVYKEISSSDEEMINGDANKMKPTALFSNDDVTGQDMYQFKTRHTVVDLQKCAQSAIGNSSMNSPRTPTKSVLKAMQNLKMENTPHHVKNMIKKRIIKEVESDSADSDFSGGSSSDFNPEGSENEQSETSQSSETDASEDEKETLNNRQKAKATKVKGKSKQKDSEYFVTPDNYFMMNSSKKIQTSDHTLAKLKDLKFDENENLDIYMSQEHKEKIRELNLSYKQLFSKWLYLLSENFNIVLYGIGSKRSVLQQFQLEKLNDFPCIVVNGFFPSLTIKSILESIVIDLLGNSHLPSNIGDTVNLIDSQLIENGAELFLIIHNIDGAMLRNGKAQSTLASLAQIKNVHLIATVDHINAPLLWDHAKLSKFRFTWWDVTTFLPYSAESAVSGPLGGTRGGALQLSSLRQVYQSLTANAKGIFTLIVEHQIENHKQPHYQGLPLKELYSKSRDNFLVSSDLALRAQLTEFLDHKLVKMKRTYDGSENLVVPIDTALLLQFIEEQNT